MYYVGLRCRFQTTLKVSRLELFLSLPDQFTSVWVTRISQIIVMPVIGSHALQIGRRDEIASFNDDYDNFGQCWKLLQSFVVQRDHKLVHVNGEMLCTSA